MGLQTVQARIDEEVARAIEDIRAKTAEEIKRIEDEAQAMIAALRAEHDRATDRILERMQTRERLDTQLISKRILLGARRDAIHAAFVAARDAVHRDAARYERFLRSRVIETLEAIDARIIHCAVGEAALIANIFAQAGREVEHEEHTHLHAGFIAQTRDRSVRFDATLASVIDELSHEIQPEIMRVLWPAPQPPVDDRPDAAVAAAPPSSPAPAPTDLAPTDPVPSPEEAQAPIPPTAEATSEDDTEDTP